MENPQIHLRAAKGKMDTQQQQSQIGTHTHVHVCALFGARKCLELQPRESSKKKKKKKAPGCLNTRHGKRADDDTTLLRYCRDNEQASRKQASWAQQASKQGASRPQATQVGELKWRELLVGFNFFSMPSPLLNPRQTKPVLSRHIVGHPRLWLQSS